MRTFFEICIVAGILATVAVAMGGCAERSASFAPTEPAARVSPDEPSRPRVMLAGYQTAQNDGSAEQSQSADRDRSESSAQTEESPQASTRVDTPRASSSNQSSRQGAAVDVESNGVDQSERDEVKSEDRGEQERRSRRPYTSPSFASTFAEGALISAGTPGGVFNPALGREVAEGSLTSQASITGERGLAASPPTARQTVTSDPRLIGTRLGGFTAASSSNIFSAQLNRSSGPNGRCAELAAAGFGGRNVCTRGLKR